MNVVSLSSGKPVEDRSNLLEVLESLRRAIEAGEVDAFVAVALSKTDVTLGYSASIGGVTRLRMMGALASLTHEYHNGALDSKEAT
jgi:hypothetical protein